MTAPAPLAPLLTFSPLRREWLHSGVPEFDRRLGGLPRGTITEITGVASSGKATLLQSVLAEATRGLECCAVVDAADGFDPASASRRGADLERLLWVRCGGNAEAAFKSVDLILHGGGFGLVCLELTDLDPRVLNRVPISYWYRFRRAVQGTRTVFLVIAEHPNARSCAACQLRLDSNEPVWSGARSFRLLRGVRFRATVCKPGPPRRVRFESLAV